MSAQRFHLAIDEAGEFLVASAARLQFGHRTAAGVDLGFLAALRARHGCLERRVSLRDGVQYWLIPDEGAPLECAGSGACTQPRRLRHGDAVALAGRIWLRFRQLSVDCASAKLSVETSEDCEGAREILLMAPGPEGALRIGARNKHHLRVPELEHEVRLELARHQLEIHCSGGFARSALPLGATTLCVALPLEGRVWIEPRARPTGKPPFALTLMPLDSSV
jgi:hypothetical protein